MPPRLLERPLLLLILCDRLLLLLLLPEPVENDLERDRDGLDDDRDPLRLLLPLGDIRPSRSSSASISNSSAAALLLLEALSLFFEEVIDGDRFPLLEDSDFRPRLVAWALLLPP